MLEGNPTESSRAIPDKNRSRMNFNIKREEKRRTISRGTAVRIISPNTSCRSGGAEDGRHSINKSQRRKSGESECRFAEPCTPSAFSPSFFQYILILGKILNNIPDRSKRNHRSLRRAAPAGSHYRRQGRCTRARAREGVAGTVSNTGKNPTNQSSSPARDCVHA